MGFAHPGHWVWDFWFAVDGDVCHLFYLHAPRSLGDPELRHRSARIGHAVSHDLLTWDVRPLPLPDRPAGSFDDLAQWTGSVIEQDGRWYLFTTGASTLEDGRRQRIGLAVSDDLVRFERTDLVLEADPRWYETLADGNGEEHWRDPWVFRDEATGRFHLLITARANTGELDGRGVVGHAVSDDLVRWEVLPPIAEPHAFRQVEVPQLVYLGGRWRVLFCVGERDHAAARLARPGVRAQSGTGELVGDSQLGPFRLERDDLVAEGDLYAGRILCWQGRDLFFGWRTFEDGVFIGELSDPIEARVDVAGRLEVVR